jgi:cation:H+ antiporter
MSHSRNISLIFVAMLASLPGFALRLLHVEPSAPITTLITGSAILGASFLLLWASDAARKDISQALALAVVALIAVLPEYAVDMYFTWQAGQQPEGAYAQYAIANMTGANRLLIGIAWTLIVGIFWFKSRRAVRLEGERRTEILFLGIATLYAFVIPLKGSLAWYDGMVFVGLYAWYLTVVSRRPPCEEVELDGPSELLGNLPRARRRMVTSSLLLFAAAVILSNAELFSEGLVGTGKILGINEFLLVQWLAPIASEAPEFTVAVMFALRGHAGIALGSLLSAKLNQWTLLVGMIPAVYGLSSGSLDNPIPMGSYQMNEILLTAAQSLLAVVLLLSLRLGPRGALLLFGLFIGQFISPFILEPAADVFPWAGSILETQYIFTVLYAMTSIYFLVRYRTGLAELPKGLGIERERGDAGAPRETIRFNPNVSDQRLIPEPVLERAASRPVAPR